MNNKQKVEEIVRLNQKKWDDWADEDILDKGTIKFFNIKFRYDFHKFQTIAVDLVDFSQSCIFLDLGCGTGWAVNYAYEKAVGKGEFYGLDISQKMVDKAEQSYKNIDKLHFIQGDSAAIPFGENFFDVIISTNSFHHYPEPVRALTEIYRVLKPGGFIFILDPTADGPVSKIINIFGKIMEKDHVNMYSTRKFKKMFFLAGIEYLYRYKNGVLRPIKVHVGRKLI